MQHYPMINSSLITSLYKTSEKNKKLNKIGLDQKINSINLTQFMYDTQPDVKRIGLSKSAAFFCSINYFLINGMLKLASLERHSLMFM